MQQPSLYQANRTQLFMFAATIFGSITAAVVVSTLVIMSLVQGQVAAALTSNLQTSTPVVQSAGTCAAPAEATSADAYGTASATSAPQGSGSGYVAYHSAAMPLLKPMFAMGGGIHNSFNSSTNNTTTTTNNVTNTEVNTTFIKDSYNDNSTASHNKVTVSDNTLNVNSNNNTAVNSGNTATTNTTNNTTTNTTNTVNSNNTTAVVANSGNTTNTTTNTTANVNSNNTVENHLLSDNTVVAVLP